MWTGESTVNRFDFEHAARQQYDGTLTAHARRRLLSAVDILIQRNPKREIWNPISNTSHEFSINFITLTVASNTNITAREGYDLLLSKWIRYMRDKYDMREYIWKAELQERGQLHYHITSNTFIPWQVIRWKWNKSQKEAGLLNEYAKKHKNFNPNSVDVHTVEKENDILAYVSKEISKTTWAGIENGGRVKEVIFDKKRQVYTGFAEHDPFSNKWLPYEWDGEGKAVCYNGMGYWLVEAKLDGKVWDASETLKRKRYIDEIDEETFRRIAAAERQGTVRRIGVERCEILKHRDPLILLSPELQKKWREKIMS